MTNETRYQLVQRSISKWRSKLGLSDWVITPAERFEPIEEGDEAYVYRMASEREAIIAIHPDTPDGYIERLVVHELLHLVHGRLDEIALVNRPVEAMDLYAQELELVLNQISTAITGLGYLPVNKDWRVRFELEEPELVPEPTPPEREVL